MAKKNDQNFGFSTKAIHAGGHPDETTGAVSPPIYATSTYVQEELGKPKLGYEYARVTNPTRDRLQENLAALEGGIAARVFASGMASITAVCMMMKQGDHLLCGDNVYGGTPRLFNQILANFGLEFSYVDTSNLRATEKAMRKNTKYVWLETPTNPLMTVSDIAAVAKIAHKGGAELIVDNTFTSPYLQRPIELGADMVMHSTTKFLNGHSDGLGGVIVCTTQQQADGLAFIQKSAGGILSPFECFLILRGVKTLGVRMDRHNENGMEVARYLDGHKKVKKVFYPGLAQSSATRIGETSDEGIRFNGHFRDRVARQCEEDAETCGAHLLACGISRRCRDADLPSGDDDARGDRGKRSQGDRAYRWHGAHLGRDRECGRHHRGFGAGSGSDIKKSATKRRGHGCCDSHEWFRFVDIDSPWHLCL